MKNMLLAASFRVIRYLIINNMRSVHVVKVLCLYYVFLHASLTTFRSEKEVVVTPSQ